MSVVNLDSSSVEIRERRLGSIVGYEGSAEQLVIHSKKGDLQNSERKFSQCSTCASGCAVCILSLIQDAAVVNHAPLGCSADFTMFNLVKRSEHYKRHLPLKNASLISTNLLEQDTVFGATEKLVQTVRQAYERFQPKAIFITASCASAIIGEDLDSVVAELEAELGIPVASVSCEGFRSQVWATGFDAAYHAILKKVVQPPVVKDPDLVNVITFWGNDVFSETFTKLGLKANLIVPFTKIEQLKKISEAAATVQMCSTLGTYLAAGLEQLYGVTEVKAPPPYGLAGTDAWYRALGKVTQREKEVEELISSEKAEISAELAELRAKLSGVTGFVAAGAVHGHSILAVLRELGVKTLGGCAWHHDPQFDHGSDEADSLRHLTDSYGDFHISICNKQVYELINQLRRLKPDVFIVRHPGMAVWGAKLGITTFLIEDEHYGLGYAGLIRLGKKIVDALSNTSFVENLAKHSRLPYTDWWLRQDPYYFLGGQR